MNREVVREYTVDPDSEVKYSLKKQDRERYNLSDSEVKYSLKKTG